ncbi:hypothetical protein Cgig2_008360 [Carnegiea gigantea]|uniref:Uncharacterized protein n=1 Tax=Carnegiea gigantea TaxID=171969 RepID=A0A9Q1QF86_9CARY|nr:hypothetical protein Cgig2_008360 [Carnegiea gigantea]
MSYRSKRTHKALGTRSSKTVQPLTHPSSSTATAQLAIQSDLKPSTQPTSSQRVSDSLVQQPPAHPSSSTARAQPAMRLNSKPPMQPSPSMTPTEALVQKSPNLFIYPTDKGFDERVLKHVAKHFKQYKHGLKRYYFKPEEKTKEDIYDIVPNGHSCDGWMRLVDYWCSKQHEIETHRREPTHLEFYKEAHSKEGGGFIANTTTEGFLRVNNTLFGVEGQLKGKVQQQSSGNDLSNESRHTGPLTSTSQVNLVDEVGLLKTSDCCKLAN